MTDHRPGGRAPRLPDEPRPTVAQVQAARRRALRAVADLVALGAQGADVDRALRSVAIAVEKARR